MRLLDIYKAKKTGVSAESFEATLLGRKLSDPHPGMARITYDGSNDEFWAVETQAGTASFYTHRPSDMEAYANITGDDIFCSACDVDLKSWIAGKLRVTNGFFNFILGAATNTSTVAEWRAWLALHPITVYYELA